MALVNGHGASDALGQDVVEIVVRKIQNDELVDVQVVYIGPAREPVLRVQFAETSIFFRGGRADFRLDQWEIDTVE